MSVKVSRLSAFLLVSIAFIGSALTLRAEEAIDLDAPTEPAVTFEAPLDLDSTEPAAVAQTEPAPLEPEAPAESSWIPVSPAEPAPVATVEEAAPVESAEEIEASVPQEEAAIAVVEPAHEEPEAPTIEEHVEPAPALAQSEPEPSVAAPELNVEEPAPAPEVPAIAHVAEELHAEPQAAEQVENAEEAEQIVKAPEVSEPVAEAQEEEPQYEPAGVVKFEHAHKKKGPELLREARALLGSNANNKDYAEGLFLEALRYELDAKETKEVMLTLAQIYDETGVTSKTAMIYENFLDKFPHDEVRPQVLIRLGRLYRDMGAYEMAIDRLYGVINMSFKAGQGDFKLYRYLTQQAQLEIADTFFLTEQYEKTIKLFSRLKLLRLEPIERERIEFKEAYAYFHLKNYEKAIEGLNKFIGDHPKSHLAAESRYILARAYRLSEQPQKSMETVMDLIHYHVDEKTPHKSAWHFWKKRTANQLANDSYEEGDMVMALRLYQSMANLSKSPDWQWPVIYQIGRCYERLQKLDKAKEAYNLIVKDEEWKDQNYTLTDTMETIQENAHWRLTHLNWIQTANSDVKTLFDPQLPEIEDTSPSSS